MSAPTLHFVSGLPRSGSTLLCNILAQNPDLHATHTSGCLDVLFGVRNHWDQLIEHQAHPLPRTKQRVLQAILTAYYSDVQQPVVFDKSRGWLAYIELAEELLQRPVKLLVPVRPLPEILASLEKLHRHTARVKQPPGEATHYFQMQTVAGRCQYWTAGEQVLGLAANRLRDAITRGLRNRLHFVHFEELASDPATVLDSIYHFLGLPSFAHNFANVQQVTTEDDGLHGYVDLHTIRPQVAPVPRQAQHILGLELQQRYSLEPWFCG